MVTLRRYGLQNNKAALTVSATIANTMSTTTLEWKHAQHAFRMIGQLPLETPQQLNLLLEFMGQAAEVIRFGNEKRRTEMKEAMKSLLLKVGLSKIYGPLKIARPVPAVGSWIYDQLISAAQEDGVKNLGEEAMLFYHQPENSHLMPDDPSVRFVVFGDSKFRIGHNEWRVHVLERTRHGWNQFHCWVGDVIDDTYVAAVA